jgi:organic radical activating enzyme
MENIKIAEIFYSIQGEGRYMGVPSIFMRTFGCNFQCAGFGMPRGQKTNELEPIVSKVELYKSYQELPLVSTGCDSYASWHPAFKHLSPFMSPDEITDKIISLLPMNKWTDEHLVITGGEPLLKWQYVYPTLLDNPRMKTLKFLTFETNGTQPITEEFGDYLNYWGRLGEVTFSVSPKLSCSGESMENAICPSVVASYEKFGNAYLKFVISTEEDAEEALSVLRYYRDSGFKGPVYFMPVGGVESVYILNNKTVAEIAMRNSIRYSDRLQVPLFKNAWGT